MSDEGEQTTDKRLYQMDFKHVEFRLTRLEEERLPTRVQAAEIMIGQLQGEVTAVKEIARGIGTKLDSGIENLTVKQSAQHQELKNDQVKNHAFIRGILWCGSGLIVLVQLSPIIGEVMQRLIGSK